MRENNFEAEFGLVKVLLAANYCVRHMRYNENLPTTTIILAMKASLRGYQSIFSSFVKPRTVFYLDVFAIHLE